MRARELASSSRLLIFKIVPAPSIVAVRLGLKRGTKVLRVKRLRLVENRPAALHDAYLTRLDLDHAALERIGSLYTLLEQQGITLVEAEETLEATLADSEIADLLEVPCHAPLLKITRLAWDRHHTPVEFLVACYRADFYRYAVRLRR
jgi:GntR family transcriptional regulator